MFSSATTSPAPPIYSPSIPPNNRHLLLLRRPPHRSSPASLSLSAGQSSSFLLPITVRISAKRKCIANSDDSEDQLSDSKTFAAEDYDDDSEEEDDGDSEVSSRDSTGSSPRRSPSSELLSLGLPEPVYEVVVVKSNGLVSIRKIHRKSLLRSSGLRPRDIRSIDPSLWLTNSMPSLLVRDHAILLNMGTLRAIVMQERVLIFNYNRRGGKAFIESLLPRLSTRITTGGQSMPFLLEVVEAALASRIQQLEQRMMDLEPRVQDLLEVLPKHLPADALEQLRTSKQTLVELGSKAAALRQMLLDLLEDTMEIRQICILGRNCILSNLKYSTEVPLEEQITEEEEEEIEMLLENYLQRCESCHGQAEKLLDSAKEMEDSMAVNLSSRRLEVSKVELLLQVGAFCLGVGALITGIFGMNLKSHLEEHVIVFCLTTALILVSVVVGFIMMYRYLRKRRVL